MTSQRDLDRDLGAYFDGRSVSRAPDGLLDAALAGIEIDPAAAAPARRRSVAAARLRPSEPRPEGRRSGDRRPAADRACDGAGGDRLVAQARTSVRSREAGPDAFDANGDLFASNPDGSGQVQLTSGPEFDDRAAYSPDGTLIAFESGQPDLSHAVFVMQATGGARDRVIEGSPKQDPSPGRRTAVRRRGSADRRRDVG